MASRSSVPTVNRPWSSCAWALTALAVTVALLGSPGPALAQGGGWQVQNLPPLPAGSTYYLTAVSAVNQNDVWVAGYIQPSGDAFIARTSDGGTIWQVVHRSALGSINRMKMFPTSGFIAGNFDLFKSTTDGGVTWNQEMGNLPVPPGDWHAVGPGGHIYGLAVADGAHIWTCGWDGYGAGIIYHRVPERPQPAPPASPNYNVPWWLEWAQNYQGMYGIAAANTQVAWAVGYQGAIWATANGGGWAPQTSGTGASLNDVVAVDVNTAWIVGDSGTILKTTDGGATWLPQTSNTVENLRRIAAFDANHAWAVGTNGLIVHTSDGGTTWTRQLSGTSATLMGITAVSATHAWAVGESNTLVATTDGGTGAWVAPSIAERDAERRRLPEQSLDVPDRFGNRIPGRQRHASCSGQRARES